MKPIAFAGVYAVPYGRPRRWVVSEDREIVFEVRRNGRRPRYHRGVEMANGVVATPEQCNIDQAGHGVRQLDELPAMPRPWTQLCRRCWGGSDVLMAAALEYARRQASRPVLEGV